MSLNHKTQFMEALENRIDYGNDINNLITAIRKAKSIPIVDLGDMSGKTMGDVAEVLALLKNCSYLELLKGFEA